MGDLIASRSRWSIIVAAVFGGAVGSKLLGLLESPNQLLTHIGRASYLMSGKSIVGGVIGGTIRKSMVSAGEPVTFLQFHSVSGSPSAESGVSSPGWLIRRAARQLVCRGELILATAF